MSKRSGRIAQEIAFALEAESSSDNLSRLPAILPKRECLQFSGFDVAASSSFHRSGPHSRDIHPEWPVRSDLNNGTVLPYRRISLV
jgi:hypothetical protein